jgi:hypothetical protein
MENVVDILNEKSNNNEVLVSSFERLGYVVRPAQPVCKVCVLYGVKAL